MFLTALESIFSECSTLEERLAACHQAGFDGMDLREHAQDEPDVCRLTKRYGLEVGMVYSALPIPLLSRTAMQRAAALEILAEKVHAAKQISARGVVIVPVFGEARIRPSVGSDLRAMELMLLDLLLGELEERLTDSGVYLAIEPLNRRGQSGTPRILVQQSNSPRVLAPVLLDALSPLGLAEPLGPRRPTRIEAGPSIGQKPLRR